MKKKQSMSLVMRRNRLERVFTFDRHFGSAGFEIVPKI